MVKLLQFSVCGVKNINKEITIDLADLSLTSKRKPNKVTAIFGFNGAGKTALIRGIYIYKNIVTNRYYLNQLSTQKEINKLTNFDTRKMKVNLTFKDVDEKVIRHSLEIENALVTKEVIEVLNRRTLNEKGKVLVSIKDGKLIDCFLDEKNTKAFKYIDSSSSSIVLSYLLKIISESDETSFKEDKILNLFLRVFRLANSLDVYMHGEEGNFNGFLDLSHNEISFETLKRELLRNKISVSDDLIFQVNEDSFEEFKKRIIKLERFIKIFKPDLIRIEANDKINGEIHNLSLVFVYENEWKIDLEYEPSGIKQLVSIFNNLINLVQGKIVFIDEMDTNINSIYLEKLIEYFMNYGEGQLVFTTHNIDTMNVLKKQSRSIIVVGDNSTSEVWVKKGNSNPINQYKEGYFLNSPICIEDFDFVKVFEAD